MFSANFEMGPDNFLVICSVNWQFCIRAKKVPSGCPGQVDFPLFKQLCPKYRLGKVVCQVKKKKGKTKGKWVFKYFSSPGCMLHVC